MAESEEATWLREQLADADSFIERYDGQWIAVTQKEVKVSSPSLAEVLESFQRLNLEKRPLLAFVIGGALQ